MSEFPAASQYVIDTFSNYDDALQRIYKETPEKGLPAISISPEEGYFLQFLLRSINATNILEIGTLGGFSATWMARALPGDGSITTLELLDQHAAVAHEHFELAGVSDTIEIVLGDARETIKTLDTIYDFIFIDAEKMDYQLYYDWAVDHIRTGGILAFHNAFLGGQIIDKHSDNERVLEMQAFNKRVAQDSRVHCTIYPAGDGMLIAIRL
ncbi:MAG: O-methyltransferase [Lentisphaeria bacterium]|nr:O-methyltransferase [Lentisphaeria bacterium]NQZ70738.1 O-methyltransferase [Lentisphaeria bacterium]